MADEQYRWLNRDAAERLLRGEPLEAVDADTRDRAARLAEALDALTAEVAPVSSGTSELPGEEAALAAFRSARTARTADSAAATSAPAPDDGHVAEAGRGSRTHTAAPAADAGVVHLGRPGRPVAGSGRRRARWGRPVRFGLVAAVAAGMLGGVTAAVGGGALTGFHDDEPEPSATVSADRSPDRPLLSPSPDPQGGDDRRGAWGDSRPDVTPDGSSEGDVPSGEGTDGADEDGRTGDTGQNDTPTQEWWNKVLSACRDVRDGKDLGADRRRGLEDAAGGKGKGQLKRYCEDLLAGGSDNPGTKKRPGGGTGNGRGTGAGSGTSDSGDSSGTVGGDKARSGGDSDEDDDSHHGKGRHGNGAGDGKNRPGHGKGHGKGGNGHGHKGDKGHGSKDSKGGKGSKGNGGNGHRSQLAAAARIDVAVRVTPS
ncbi:MULTISPECIES: hypothetical protein [unclassified Streptomyces]|uniref:hypothetical protein n=1 Tax=unclassified Streptomyces TaxID=2593676 RepID=UPI002E77AA39|nr:MULTISPECIES: hypothetical protein [unclassified Streptomyces]MEE1759007.1 hypothetical protein [Streptomyces sp. SP18BB07]MEE1833928.1 hypothetical protein [Streptomyces sp. SP17KL33]